MKQIIILAAIFTTLGISCSDKEHMGERLGKAIAKGIIKGAPLLGSEAAKSLGDAGIEIAKTAAPALVESSQKIGFDSVTKASDSFLKATAIASVTSKDVSKTAAEALIKSSQKVGLDAVTKGSDAFVQSTQIVADAGKDISKTAAEGLIKSSEKVGSEAAGKLVEGIAPYAGAVVGIFAIKEAAVIGIDLYKYNNPDKEKIAKEEVATETIEFIGSKRAFRNCLMQNAYSKKNEIGFPISCEPCGNKFAMTAGRAAYKDMVDTFKETYKQ